MLIRFPWVLILAACLAAPTVCSAKKTPGQRIVALTTLIRTQDPGACTEEAPKLWRCGQKLKFEGLHDIDVQGEGLHIQFTDPEVGRGGIQILQASHVAMSDFTISWRGSMLTPQDPPDAKPIFSMGRVASCAGGGQLALQVPITGAQPVDVVSAWDVERGWPWSFDGPPAIDISFEAGHRVNFEGGRSPCLKELAPIAGQDVVVQHRRMTNHAWQCVECTSFKLQAARVLSAPGMAFVFEGGRDLAILDSVVPPACAPHCTVPTPSTTADASHFSDSAGTITVAGNDFSFQGDDGINVSSLLLRATLESPGVVGENSHRWVTVSRQSQFPMTFFSQGDEVVAYSKGLARIGSGQVLTKDKNNSRLLLDFTPTTSDILLSTKNRATTRITIERNHIHDNRARGILLTNDNALIRKNTIERVTMNAILLAGDSFYFYEGPGAKNVRISDNLIRDTNFASPRQRFPSTIDVGTVTPDADNAVPGAFTNICVDGNKIERQEKDKSAPVTNPYLCSGR